MNIMHKETFFSWVWRKTHKENLPPPYYVIILCLLSFQSLSGNGSLRC